MPDISRIASVIAKHEGASAPAASEAASAAPSGAGEAPADGTNAVDGGESSSPGAAIDTAAQERAHALELQREQLQELKRRNRERAEEKRLKAQGEQLTAKEREVEEEKAKWARIGKDKSFLDGIRELGLDPRQVYEAMTEEAVKAGTPEAQMKSLEARISKMLEERLAPVAEKLKVSEEERERLKKEAEDRAASERKAASEAAFKSRFGQELADASFASLREEYEDDILLAHAENLRDSPELMGAQAEAVGYRLTDPTGRYNMHDIFRVLLATQQQHVTQKARRASAQQPQTDQPPSNVARRVNGTVERKPPPSLGSDLASETAAALSPRMTRAQKLAAAMKKHG